MSKTTASTISHNLPDFPYTPAPAARSPLSALLSSSHFVTTLVSPASGSQHSPSSDPADPHQERADFFSAQASPSSSQGFPPSPAPVEHLSAPIDHSLLQSSRQPLHSQSSKQPPPRAAEISTSSLLSAQTCKPSSSSPTIFKEPSRPALIELGDRGSLTTPRRCRSSWRHLKRMGNRIVTPFRSMGICITGGCGVRDFCGDRSADVSPGSSWCSSGEYPPEFIRAVLENNALLGHLTLD